MEKVKVDSFIRDFCKGKTFDITPLRLSIAVEKDLGVEATPKEITASVKKVLKNNKNQVVAASGRTCPRCKSFMEAVVLADNRPADYCPNDRVTLPQK